MACMLLSALFSLASIGFLCAFPPQDVLGGFPPICKIGAFPPKRLGHL